MIRSCVVCSASSSFSVAAAVVILVVVVVVILVVVVVVVVVVVATTTLIHPWPHSFPYLSSVVLCRNDVARLERSARDSWDGDRPPYQPE